MNETDILQAIRLDLGALPTVRLFRNNVGACRDKTGRLVRYGLASGSPDLIGLRTIIIRPDMVGRAVALFVGIEVKTRTGRVTEDQASFIDMLFSRGALAGVARSAEEAHRIITL